MQSTLIKLQELISNFDIHRQEYLSGKYDETQVRHNFIDKFFILLGWDVNNDKGNSLDYCDVLHEDKIIIENRPKAPDYSFKIGKERVFFVEAKKPSIPIGTAIEPAFQLRRYSYTAKLPFSILTDFQEFAIYDTTIKPNKTDKASIGRTFYCKYTEYENNCDYIYNIFSKEAVLKGSLKKYIEDSLKKRGTSQVDK
ncbi:MAG: hypothetical protein JXA68_03535, partial [Ignavibacteriales bacterium]|nr:hypothetical protein [Ignavibacteriales bacterium]